MLQALSCPVCGHRYRTRFVEPPVEKTEAFTLMVTPPVAVRPPRRAASVRTFRLAFLGSFLVVALVGGLVCLGWSIRQPASALSPKPLASSSASVSPALHLYQAIKPAMSLYDLDKAAGGMGHVVHVADPHALLLFYEYPPQTVHVLLSRPDIAGADYQVQAVALWQGKVLLQRRAGME